MKKIPIALSVLLACAVSMSTSADPKTPGTHKGYSTIEMLSAGVPSDLNMVSVDNLAKELQANQR